MRHLHLIRYLSDTALVGVSYTHRRRLLWVTLACLLGAPHSSAAPASPPRPQVRVSSVDELNTAVSNANASRGHRTIILSDGYYRLTHTLVISAPNVSVVSATDRPAQVVIAGDGMRPDARVQNLFKVSAPDFRLRGITLERSGAHLIQIAGESEASRPVIQNCILRDAFQQLLKVSWDPAHPDRRADGGLVENCLFEYTAGIGPQFYIGGIDAHAARNWTVRRNTFRNIASPGPSVAEFAIHFWSGSADNLVEKNLIINCDRGIGFGLDGSPNTRGIIRNNFVYHTAAYHRYADVGISLIESPGSSIYNNTILVHHGYPWAIEYRFKSTRDVRIFNNLSNRPLAGRDGARGVLESNLTTFAPNLFHIDAQGIPRLRAEARKLVRAGRPVPELVDDYFGRTRPPELPVDIGAEQVNPGE